MLASEVYVSTYRDGSHIHMCVRHVPSGISVEGVADSGETEKQLRTRLLERLEERFTDK